MLQRLIWKFAHLPFKNAFFLLDFNERCGSFLLKKVQNKESGIITPPSPFLLLQTFHTAFSFGNEVNVLDLALVKRYRPIGRVIANGRRYLKRAGQFCINANIAVVTLQIYREFLFGVAVHLPLVKVSLVYGSSSVTLYFISSTIIVAFCSLIRRTALLIKSSGLRLNMANTSRSSPFRI